MIIYIYIYMFNTFVLPYPPGPNENLGNHICLSSISLKLPQLYVPGSLVTMSTSGIAQWQGWSTEEQRAGAWARREVGIV